MNNQTPKSDNVTFWAAGSKYIWWDFDTLIVSFGFK
jgi:hypothetical protein